MSAKIKANHLNRRAVIYIRQSTMQQVHEHPESTARQYALQQLAKDLGWTPNAVMVIDEDLGQSGASAQSRTGFQRLAEEVAHGRVGAIFALEVSRLARCSADWHKLLDLCGWADVVIGDEQGLYTPRDQNDRLLLGLKGQMSEAERYWLKLRMQGAKLSKARRGELRLVPPTGYQWDDVTKRLCKDPDEQVQAAVRLLFQRFQIEGSATRVQRYFIERGLKMPARRIATGVGWVSPRPRTILDILHSPIYTGAYVYGRREVRTRLVDGELRRSCVEPLPMEEWKVCIRDHHPAYISWEEYMFNQRKLQDNCRSAADPSKRGAAREGSALLQGLVLCGQCGYRMTVDYGGKKRRPRYVCRSPIMNGSGSRICWSLSARAVDEEVSKRFLDAAQLPELELALAVAHEAEKQADELDRQWQLRLERVRYETTLAERRYKAVDPDNRVVARTLEGEWDHKLQELDEVERDYEESRRIHKVELSDDDRSRILELARDLPEVWKASTTTQTQRKNLLRILVRQVTLSPIDVPRRLTRIQVLWDGGAVSDFTVERPRNVVTHATPSASLELIHELVEAGKFDSEIADELNRQELSTASGSYWNADSVGRVRRYRKWKRPNARQNTERLPNQREDGLYSVHGVSSYFSVSKHVVRHWVSNGQLVPAEGGGQGRPCWFKLDVATIERLRKAIGHASRNLKGGVKAPREEVLASPQRSVSQGQPKPQRRDDMENVAEKMK